MKVIESLAQVARFDPAMIIILFEDTMEVSVNKYCNIMYTKFAFENTM